MKVPNKKGFQQTALNYLSDTDFKGILDLYKNCTAKPFFFFLMNDTTLASNNIFHFRNNLLERI